MKLTSTRRWCRQNVFQKTNGSFQTGANVWKVSRCVAQSQWNTTVWQYYSANYCPKPPDPPVNGTVAVLQSGVHFGTVCPGRNGAEAPPMVGCENHNMNILHDSTTVGGTYATHTYSIMVNADVQGTFVALLSFSQPMSEDDLQFSSSQVSPYPDE